MNADYQLEFAATTNDVARARSVAYELGGVLYVDERDAGSRLPFRAMLTTVTDDVEPLRALGDVGLYIVCRRPIVPGACRVMSVFSLIRHPDLSHRQADAHWRDVHAPLALQHHRHMTHYTQLSVVQRISGLEIDGFALCGFDSLVDLRNRFFSESDSREAITADMECFTDMKRLPRPLIATQLLN